MGIFEIRLHNKIDLYCYVKDFLSSLSMADDFYHSENLIDLNFFENIIWFHA